MLARIQARIVLENEDKGAIAAMKAEYLAVCSLDSFSSDISSSYQVSGQNA